MQPIHLDGVTAEQLKEIDALDQTSRDSQVRIRALMVLLAAERRMVGGRLLRCCASMKKPCGAGIARYQAKGTVGLY